MSSLFKDDITFCLSGECPRKYKCYRAKEHRPGEVYSASDFTNICTKEDYDYYMPAWPENGWQE